MRWLTPIAATVVTSARPVLPRAPRDHSDNTRFVPDLPIVAWPRPSS